MSRSLDESTLKGGRFVLVVTAGLAGFSAAYGVFVGAPSGGLSGAGIWLVASCLVVSILLLWPLLTWPIERLPPIAFAATTYFGAYLTALGIASVLDPGSRVSLIVSMVWFIPLQAFNKIMNRGEAARILGWALIAAPLLVLGLMSPQILAGFPPPLIAVLVTCALAQIGSALMLNTLWRYREAFITEQEVSSRFRFAASILEGLSESFILVDRTFRLAYLSESAGAVLGVGRAEAEGRPLAEAVAGFAPHLQALQDAWSGNGPTQFEIEVAGRLCEVRCTPGREDMSVYLHDISEERATQERLRKSETLLKIAGRISRMGGWEYRTLDGRVVVSDEVAAIYEVPPGTVGSVESSFRGFSANTRSRAIEIFRRRLADGTPFDEELEILTATGRPIWVRLIGEAIRDADGAILGMQGALQDITARRETEQALRAGELRLAEQAEVLDKAKDAIIVRDMAGRILYWNESAARLYGLASEDAVGRPIHEVLGVDLERTEEVTARVIEAGEWRRVVKLPAQDGRILVVDSHLSLVRDEAGRPKSILAINTDITAQVAAEERVRQSERLEAVGQFTGGVAHDFNNLLTVIIGNAEIMIDTAHTPADVQELSVMIKRAAERGAALTKRLLAFAQRQTLEPRSVDTQALLAEAGFLLRRALREDITLTVMHTVGTWNALVDPAQLESAILNLCVNARDAMPQGGSLTIEAANIEFNEAYAGADVQVSPGQYVAITVTDTGTGIEPELLGRVFDPFFTTKDVGKGTGLGLSIVYGFIKQSQGHIAVYSEVGHGTSVKMYLPRAVSPAVPTSAEGVPPEDIRGSQTILVVEDDDLLRRNVEHQLTSLGYRVITSPNGREALELIRTGPHIDLLFTDVVMPGGVNGLALALAACETLPSLRVLYTSGHPENAIVHDGRLDPGVLLLSKPYVRSELALKVRAALESA